MNKRILYIALILSKTAFAFDGSIDSDSVGTSKYIHFSFNSSLSGVDGNCQLSPHAFAPNGVKYVIDRFGQSAMALNANNYVTISNVGCFFNGKMSYDTKVYCWYYSYFAHGTSTITDGHHYHNWTETISGKEYRYSQWGTTKVETQIPREPQWNGVSDATYIVWLKINSFPRSPLHNVIFSREVQSSYSNTCTSNALLQVVLSGTGGIGIRQNDTTEYSGNSLKLGDWYCLAFVGKANDKISLYLNGDEWLSVKTGMSFGNLPDGDGRRFVNYSCDTGNYRNTSYCPFWALFEAGARDISSNILRGYIESGEIVPTKINFKLGGFDGEVDDFSIVNLALSASDVKNIYEDTCQPHPMKESVCCEWVDTNIVVDVMAPSDLSWTISNSVPWIVVNDGEDGVGNGSVSLSIQKNPGIARSGIVQIAGVDVCVSQAEAAVYAPTFQPTDGSFFIDDSCIVTITCDTANASIYFSTNGITPRAVKGNLYVDGVDIGDTTSFKAIAVCDGIKSAYSTAKITRQRVSLGDCIVQKGSVKFSTGGDAQWRKIKDLNAMSDSLCVRSGLLSSAQGVDWCSTWLEAIVVGSGTLSFWINVSCEKDDSGECTWDHASWFCDDVELGRLDGETGWLRKTINITNGGRHVIKWGYYKDCYDDEVKDFDGVMIDDISWNTSDLPDVGENPTLETIGVALGDFADERLQNSIADKVNYLKFGNWANCVKIRGQSDAAGMIVVKNAPYSWLSFALASETLIESAPTNGQMKVESFAPAAEAGKFDFTVGIEDIAVGANATEENLKRVFELEGGATLDDLSSKNVDIAFGAPVDGKVKFTAGPKEANMTNFFMKVKMTP